MSPVRTITKRESRKAAREWRRAESLLSEAVALLIQAEAALIAGELATRQRPIVHDLIDEVRNVRSNVGYDAGEEERAAER